VIIQVWLSTHFGVISERLGAADESSGFIEASFTPPSCDCKGAFDALLPPGLARWLANARQALKILASDPSDSEKLSAKTFGSPHRLNLLTRNRSTGEGK